MCVCASVCVRVNIKEYNPIRHIVSKVTVLIIPYNVAQA